MDNRIQSEHLLAKNISPHRVANMPVRTALATGRQPLASTYIDIFIPHSDLNAAGEENKSLN